MATALYWDGKGIEHCVDADDPDAVKAAKAAGWADHPPAIKPKDAAVSAPVTPAKAPEPDKSDLKKGKK